MNLITATIPDDPAQLPGWLETQLIGNDLGQLVAELSVIHRATARPPKSIRELLRSKTQLVLLEGLKNLPRELLQQLLRQPAYLLDLQELILLEGGPYWESPHAPETRPAEPKKKSRGRFLGPLLIGVLSTAAAAVILLVLNPGGWFRSTTTNTNVVQAKPLGLNRPEVLAANVPGKDYLNNLANAMEDDWLPKEPENAEQLLARIGDIRQGCSKLLLADLAQLPETERKDLKDRCRNWANQFDEQRKEVENDPATAVAVHEKTNALLRKMVQVLRDRADKLKAA